MRWRLIMATAAALLPYCAYGDEEGIEGQRGEALDAVCQRYVHQGFAGVVLAARGEKTFLLQGYGEADPASGRANTPDTLFEIASLTKQFTAAAILALEEDGKLSTEDRLSDLLPAVPESYREVTIYQALTHTGGLPRGGQGRGLDLSVAVAKHLSKPPATKPGRYAYSNVGYALLAGVVETVSGKPYPEYLRERLFLPAGLVTSCFCGDATATAPVAVGLARDGGVARRTPLVDPYPPLDEYGYEYRGMGGIVTSVLELQRWIHALQTDRVLGVASRRKLFTVCQGDYACGWEVFRFPDGQRCIGHGGAVSGYAAKLWWFPDEGALLVVLTNRDGFDYRMLGELRKAIFDGEQGAGNPEEGASG